MHPIRAYVLKNLIIAEKARYSEIKPPKIGGNQFAYHLKKIMDLGLIEKAGSFYKLTAKGIRVADGFSLKMLCRRPQPKIVNMIVCHNERGQILLYKMKRQPFFGKLALPYGKMHMEEMVDEAARREVKEKTGLISKSLRHCGEVYLLIYKDGRLVAHMLAHIFTGDFSSKEKIADACLWVSPDKISFAETLPGTKEILRLTDKKHIRFFEEIYWEV